MAAISGVLKVANCLGTPPFKSFAMVVSLQKAAAPQAVGVPVDGAKCHMLAPHRNCEIMPPSQSIVPILSLATLGSYRGVSIERTNHVRTHTANLDVDLNYLKSTHHTRFVADIHILRNAHNGFAVLNTDKKNGATSLTPLQKEAGEFSDPQKCRHPRKHWLSKWCKLKTTIYTYTICMHL